MISPSGSDYSKKSYGRSQLHTSLYFDGNPSKWLQGHNLFGSDNLIALMGQVIQRLIPLLKLGSAIKFTLKLSSRRSLSVQNLAVLSKGVDRVRTGDN
jgi:II/X family phage/plasmid replication protein